MSIKTGAITGAVAGTGIAVFLLALDYVRPFSPNANAFIENLTFKLCPFYVLGFTNYLSKEWLLVFWTVIGNAIVYAIIFALITGLLSLVKHAAINRTPDH